MTEDNVGEGVEVPTPEEKARAVSADVERVRDHLVNNRTTETEARRLREAADRSLTDHAVAKSLGRST